MRRRQTQGQNLTAPQLVAEFDRLMADHPTSPADVRAGMYAVGYDPVAAVRARRWLRHGKPKSWRWDAEADVSSLADELAPWSEEDR